MVYLFLWTRNLVYTDETKIENTVSNEAQKKFVFEKYM